MLHQVVQVAEWVGSRINFNLIRLPNHVPKMAARFHVNWELSVSDILLQGLIGNISMSIYYVQGKLGGYHEG